MITEREKSRRKFLKYLAASPLFAAGAKSASAEGVMMGERPADPFAWFPYDPNYVVEKPEDALDVFELEAVAAKKMPAAHFGFVASGADGDGSVIANRRDMSKFSLRGRRLRDVRKVDTSREIFGVKYATPFYLCPVGFERAANTDGVTAAAKATGRHNIAHMLSTYASLSPQEAAEARGGKPVFFQLYNQPNFEMTKFLVQQAERAGAKLVAFTIDNGSMRKNVQFERSKRQDSRLCIMCHEVRDPKQPKEIGADIKGAGGFKAMPEAVWNDKTPSVQNWELVKRLRDITKMDIMLKGVMHPDDAEQAAKLGYGVYVSNHGGRNEDTSGSTIGALPDIVSVVKGRVPIFIDGGFRRGMDIAKAIAMGATMVGFGRPWMWGLGAFGEAGVDRVLQIMTAEFVAAMQQVGAANLKELDQSLVFNSLYG